jgi:hypothetical protein|tara:strand:+ start:816 stop:962 length:147 start_codon:yes stop_codon:yes gene_type:complete
MRDLFFDLLLRQVLLVELGGCLEHFNLFGFFADLAFVALGASVLIFCG